MKLVFAAAALFASFTLFGQNKPAQDDTEWQFLRELTAHPAAVTLLSPQPLKANEVKINGRTYGGILVELAKTGKPFELINPWAPAEYGSPEDNIARDANTGRVLGWKLFSIQF